MRACLTKWTSGGVRGFGPMKGEIWMVSDEEWCGSDRPSGPGARAVQCYGQSIRCESSAAGERASSLAWFNE